MSRIRSSEYVLSVRRRAVAPMVVALLAAMLLLLGIVSQGNRAWADDGGQLVVGVAATVQSDGQLEAEAATSNGRWVLTETNFYNPANPPSKMKNNKGPVGYTSKQNENYKYDDSYLGTEKGYVRFLVSGGYKGPGDWGTRDTYHECSQPAKSYKPGAKAEVTLKTHDENKYGWGSGGNCNALLYKEDKALPSDGRSKFFNGSGWVAYFEDADGNAYVDPDKGAAKVSATMPSEAEPGDRVAIVFITNSSYDSWGSSYENNYGGHQLYEWIYTFKAAPAKGAISSIKNVKGAKAKVIVKAAKGAQKYQVRYRVGNAKKWKVAKAKKSRTFIVKAKKGAKVKAQARVMNAAGWGKWGKAKSLKTDRK